MYGQQARKMIVVLWWLGTASLRVAADSPLSPTNSPTCSIPTSEYKPILARARPARCVFKAPHETMDGKNLTVIQKGDYIVSGLPSGISTPKVDHALGRSSRELDRLSFQGTVFVPHTRQFVTEAGLNAGMRVLDVGTGSGGVSFLAADLVGSNGYVLGVDQSSVAVERARSRASRRNLTNVRFELGDPAAMHFDRFFDAIIGRFVLLYQDDPATSGKNDATSSSGWLGCVSRSGLHGMVVVRDPLSARKARSLADTLPRSLGRMPSTRWPRQARRALPSDNCRVSKKEAVEAGCFGPGAAHSY